MIKDFINRLYQKNETLMGGVFLTIEQSYQLRGIAMVIIIISHLCNHLRKVYEIDTGYLSFRGEFGNAIFLFVSGYGIYLSMLKRGDKLNLRYMWQHIVKIIVPFVIAFVVTFVGCYVMGDDYDFSKAAKDFSTMTIPFTREWFLKAIMMLYAFAFVAFKIFSVSQKRILMVVLFTCVYCIIGFFVGLGAWMFNTVLCFAGGMFVASIQNLMQDANWVKMFVACSILFVICLWIPLPYIKSTLYGFFLSLALVYGVKLVKLDSRIFHFIGLNSILLYLFHIGFVHVHYSPIVDPILTTTIAITCTFAYIGMKKYINRVIIAIS